MWYVFRTGSDRIRRPVGSNLAVSAAGQSSAILRTTAEPVAPDDSPAPLPLHGARHGASPRLALLDVMRIVAALGIIWVHAATSEAGKMLSPVGTFGVPFYTYLAVLFMARGLTRRDQQRSLGGYIASRLYRVYLPFLFWSVVYLTLQETKGFIETHRLPNLSWRVLYYGGHEHLWFLPYLMIVTIVGAILVRGLHDRKALRIPTIILLLATGAAACLWKEPTWVAKRVEDIDFWKYAFRALPTVFFSIALALGTASDGKLPKSTAPIATGGAFLFILALLLQISEGPLKVLRTCAGLGVLLVALYPIHAPLTERLGRLGRYSYGIYLSHLLFIRIVAMWTARWDIPSSLTLDLFTFCFAFIGASVLSVLMSQSKYTRWTLGE